MELEVIINANLVPRFFPSGRKRANQMSSSTNYTYSPKTFNRCQGEIHIVQDSMSDSEGNKKQIMRVQNCIFKCT